MDDINESPDTVEQPGSSGRVDRALRTGLDRRTMLKAAVATGTIAATWVAPRIETLGFSPAAAAGTPCVILSPGSDDRNSNSGGNDCPVVTKPCCGQSFGNAGQIERFTFANPVANCSQIVVRTVTLDAACDVSNKNPDVGQFALVIESTTGTGCGACTVMDGVLVASSGRAVLKHMNNGPVACLSGGVDASLSCSDPLLTSSARLAVRLKCLGGKVGCTPP